MVPPFEHPLSLSLFLSFCPPAPVSSSLSRSSLSLALCFRPFLSFYLLTGVLKHPPLFLVLQLEPLFVPGALLAAEYYLHDKRPSVGNAYRVHRAHRVRS